MSLFAELKRRKVHRVAAMYGVVAWVITEVSSTVFPALGVPDWAISAVVVLLIIGFPIAMVLAWVFDISPKGIVRTDVVDPPEPHGTHEERGHDGVFYTVLLVAGTVVLTLLLYHAGLKGYDWLAGERPNSIAVLPFKNFSSDPANNYFGDSIAEELLNLLTKTPGLQVLSRTSSFAYRENQDIKNVGAELDVSYVLEGSVLWSEDDKIRITAQLVDTSDGFHLWSNTYDRKFEDIFKVQDEISQQIVSALQVQLAADEQAPTSMGTNAPPSGDLEAYRFYLDGRSRLRQRGERGVLDSIELFEKALRKDPGYGRAMAGQASAYAVMSGYTDTSWEEAWPIALDKAEQALSIDPTLAEAHAVRGLINLTEGDWTDARADFLSATALDPDESTGHHWYSILLMRTGRLDDALDEAKEAYRIDPDSPIINSHLADVYLAGDDAENALKYYVEADNLGLATNQPGSIATANFELGNYDEARSQFEVAFNNFGFEFDPKLIEEVLKWFGNAGSGETIVAAVEELQQPLPPQFAFALYVYGGDPDKAMDAAFEIATNSPDQLSYQLIWSHRGDAFREHPRFVELGDRLRLTTYWKRYGWPDACRTGKTSLNCE